MPGQKQALIKKPPDTYFHKAHDRLQLDAPTWRTAFCAQRYGPLAAAL